VRSYAVLDGDAHEILALAVGDVALLPSVGAPTLVHPGQMAGMTARVM
jgi:hypothetical protein